jgi:hypothetical protein
VTPHDPGVPLARNMSAPPKTTISWNGLGATFHPTSRDGRANLAPGKHEGMFGIPVRFTLAPALVRKRPVAMLRHLGHRPGTDAAEQLDALIDMQAASLPLPDGCAVIACHWSHRTVWEDTLTILAVLTKSSGAVWLRSKSPSLAAMTGRRDVSLLVPPAFATQLPGAGT